MATVKLQISEKVLDKVLWLLSQFKKEELEILEGGEAVDGAKLELQANLQRIEAGEAKLFSTDEADELLEKSILKYEG